MTEEALLRPRCGICSAAILDRCQAVIGWNGLNLREPDDRSRRRAASQDRRLWASQLGEN
jgi:hypothetical protein